MKIRHTIILSALAACALPLSATSQDSPRILTVQPLYGGGLNGMSASGRWAVGDAPNPGNSSMTAFPRLVDTATGQTIEIFSEDEGMQSVPMGASAVSDDGKTVVGSYQGLPAVWKEGEGWSHLPMPQARYNSGMASAITPDGRYAVGRVSVDLFMEYPCMWDLREMTLVPLPGMVDRNPRYADMLEAGGDPAEWNDAELNVRLTGITPDGNVLLGMVDYAFPNAAWEFIYRRDAESWQPLGMTYAGGRLVPSDPDIYNVEECVFSPDGRYIGGTYWSVSETSVPFMCTVDDPDSFSLIRDGEGYGVWAVGNDGVVYGSAPVGTPVRNWSARVGDYWYDWKTVLRQVYGIDWMADITGDDMGLSGSLAAVSADGLTLLAADWASRTSYIISLPKPMAEICREVDLLGDYSVYPPEGAEFSSLRTVTLDMGREVSVCGEKTDARILDASGKGLRASINISVRPDNRRLVEIIFRNYTLQAGEDYTVVIPAGTIGMAEDSSVVNREIRVRYRGREAGPVRPVAFSPEEGTSVPRINLTTNPVTVTFDAAVAPGEEPKVSLYQIKDGQEEYLFPLGSVLSGRQVMVYPVSEQRLAAGCDYRIEFGAGSVTDLSGAGANETFSMLYHGSYVPEIDPSSNTIYHNDFSLGVAGMMLYEGDFNSPCAEMAEWGFDSDSTPWIPVLDDDDTEGNYAAASHSAYEPAGQSDDWMVTPQLYIPDDKARLTFRSQSHRTSGKDMLRVYVWASDDVVTVMTGNVADRIRYGGDLVCYELQSPGENEDVLRGEWRDNAIDLSAYAGKNIYIAFVNDNRNQSAVFIDDVLVSREVPAIVSVDTEKSMIDAGEAVIKGRIVAMRPTGLSGYTLTLADADSRVIASLESDRVLAEGEVCGFEFPEPVVLAGGSVNTFYITLVSGSESVSLRHEISNLLFPTTRRVVLEEMTGTTCQFCPQGIIATDYLKQLYGDLVIPVAIHSYIGDSFGTSEHKAYSDFLGLYAAPMAVAGRGAVASPMYFEGGDYVFTAPDGATWLQRTEEALAGVADADVKVTSVDIDEDDRSITVGMEVTFAIARSGANFNLFGVVMEDGLFGIQTNGLASISAPGLGEWGKDGSLGQGMVIWYYDDVVRGTSAVETAGVYSGFNGTGGYIPAQIEAGSVIDVSFSMPLPRGIDDMEKTKVCMMLIDANTGRYVNAAVAPAVGSGVVSVDGDTGVVADVYDLAGRIVMRNAGISDLKGLEKGIYIYAGKKYAVD